METDFDFEDEQPDPAPLDPNIRRQLREAEKARKELEAMRAELKSQQLEVQFAKAGIPESGVGSLFRKAYEGPVDAEAIRRSAEEYGVLSPNPSDLAIDQSDAELAALRRAQGATVGTSGSFPDPGQEFLARLAEASNPEDVMKIVQSQTGQNLGVWSSRDAR